ncbi:MAG: hypothetical protein ACJA0T_000005 [Colwellia sp.]|jgi:hypothetical protein
MCRISVGIKTTLGKANSLSIVILWFDFKPIKEALEQHHFIAAS